MTNLPQDDLPADMWLHVATDALGRFASGGTDLIVFMAEDEHGRRGVCFYLPYVDIDDPRFAPSFVAQAIVTTSMPLPTPAPQEEPTT